MSIEQYIKQEAEFESPETPEGRTARFNNMMYHLLGMIPGNIVEIGAGSGQSTKVLAEAATRQDRKVLVIDPWDSVGNMPAGYGQYAYRDFIMNTKPYLNIIVCQRPSHHKEVGQFMSGITPIAFAFVDGLQFVENVLSDLFLCSAFGAEIICVDDINRSTDISQVPIAVDKFLKGNNKYKRIETPNLIECYLIRLS
jgi:hypothetical protein